MADSEKKYRGIIPTCPPLVLASNQSRIFAIGDIGEHSKSLHSVESFDPVENKWTYKQPTRPACHQLQDEHVCHG